MRVLTWNVKFPAPLTKSDRQYEVIKIDQRKRSVLAAFYEIATESGAAKFKLAYDPKKHLLSYRLLDEIYKKRSLSTALIETITKILLGENNGRLVQGGMLIRYDLEKVKIEEWPQIIPYHTQAFSRGQITDEAVVKSIHKSKLNHPDIGSFYFLATHLVCPSEGEGDYNDQVLEIQVDQLYELVKELRDKNETIIISGDLNFMRQEQPYHRFLNLTRYLEDKSDIINDAKSLLASENISPEEIYRYKDNGLKKLEKDSFSKELSKKGYKISQDKLGLGLLTHISTNLLSSKKKVDHGDEQYYQLLQEVRERTTNGERVLLFGDQIKEEFTPLYKKLIKGGLLVDLTPDQMYLDYILGSPGLTATKVKEFGYGLSDHLGLMAEIYFKR